MLIFYGIIVLIIVLLFLSVCDKFFGFKFYFLYSGLNVCLGKRIDKYCLFVIMFILIEDRSVVKIMFLLWWICFVNFFNKVLIILMVFIKLFSDKVIMIREIENIMDCILFLFIIVFIILFFDFIVGLFWRMFSNWFSVNLCCVIIFVMMVVIIFKINVGSILIFFIEKIRIKSGESNVNICKLNVCFNVFWIFWIFL